MSWYDLLWTVKDGEVSPVPNTQTELQRRDRETEGLRGGSGRKRTSGQRVQEGNWIAGKSRN